MKSLAALKSIQKTGNSNLSFDLQDFAVRILMATPVTFLSVLWEI